MQKSLNTQQVADARRKNSMMLAGLFGIIALSAVFAFGLNVLYVIAFFGIPVMLFKMWEEVNRQYFARKPRRK